MQHMVNFEEHLGTNLNKWRLSSCHLNGCTTNGPDVSLQQ